MSVTMWFQLEPDMVKEVSEGLQAILIALGILLVVS